MKNKWLLIGIAVAVVAIGIFAAMSARGGTNDQPNVPAVSATPAAPEPTSSTPISSTPSTPITPTPTPINLEGKVWTVKELISEFLANPDKFKRGEIIQLSGIYTESSLITSNGGDFRFGPPIIADHSYYGKIELFVIVNVGVTPKERELGKLKPWTDLQKGDRAVIKGVYHQFDKLDHSGVYLGDATIISVTAAK